MVVISCYLEGTSRSPRNSFIDSRRSIGRVLRNVGRKPRKQIVAYLVVVFVVLRGPSRSMIPSRSAFFSARSGKRSVPPRMLVLRIEGRYRSHTLSRTVSRYSRMRNRMHQWNYWQRVRQKTIGFGDRRLFRGGSTSSVHFRHSSRFSRSDTRDPAQC